MSVFVINKRFNGNFKFVFTNRKGKTIFTSISCKHKEDCKLIIKALKEDTGLFTISRGKTPAGKLFFRLSRNGLVLATSRKFSTELSLTKGIDDTLKYIPSAETLDLPDEEDVFATDNL